MSLDETKVTPNDECFSGYGSGVKFVVHYPVGFPSNKKIKISNNSFITEVPIL